MEWRHPEYEFQNLATLPFSRNPAVDSRGSDDPRVGPVGVLALARRVLLRPGQFPAAPVAAAAVPFRLIVVVLPAAPEGGKWEIM